MRCSVYAINSSKRRNRIGIIIIFFFFVIFVEKSRYENHMYNRRPNRNWVLFLFWAYIKEIGIFITLHTTGSVWQGEFDVIVW